MERFLFEVLLVFLSFGLGHAQLPIPPPNAATTTTSTAPTSSTSNAMPSTSDDAPGSGSNPGDGTGGISSYYFVFVAIFLCIAGLGGFLIWWRKHRMTTLMQANRELAMARDWGDRRRTYQGRWHSAEHSREDGLNERGEAPPPYIPKTPEEEAAENGAHSQPAIPLRTLSRELAGMKPPDYSETTVRRLDRNERSSTASASSSSRHIDSPYDLPPLSEPPPRHEDV